MTQNVPNLFSSMVFNDECMKARLPKDAYKELKRAMDGRTPLELSLANIVANAMKNWAIEKGVTHFTHWFQPMTGITAEKHDSFISPVDAGNVIMEFSGKELVKGEPDASSFPSGGLRATFEARGYTIWDTTSFAFIKDETLCIPTAFCSYSGEALDKKTPLLRSMEAINIEALKIVRLFGDDRVKKINTTVGPEQEYFLISKEMYKKRPDLMITGRTLFGARPNKGQEMDDHYFGMLKPRVAAFMRELDEELWKLGVLAKTKHNEAAPAQHELAPIFTTTNIATDHNQITMELMQKIADRHGLACLLHEKPFAGINGSGKHNNWSLSTDSGENLLEPGNTPSENKRFLLFLAAVVKAVDEHQDLLRLSAASAGNDHRLGACEAPPAIISIFLGDDLEEIVESIVNKTPYDERGDLVMESGATVLPNFIKDTTDRNRTSPFAFTGNKFEFRMPGSTFSIAGPNFILNTIVAESLREFSKELEGAKDFDKAVYKLTKNTFKKHKRIIFNGNNYTSEWVDEAEKRGLLNLATTVDAMPRFTDEKNIKIFEAHKVLTKNEIHSRCEILLDNYAKTIQIEALTMVDMAKKEILPASSSYQSELVRTANDKLHLDIDATFEKITAQNLAMLTKEAFENMTELETQCCKCTGFKDTLELATHCKDSLVSGMSKLRLSIDKIESMTAKKYWPLPTYSELLNSCD